MEISSFLKTVLIHPVDDSSSLSSSPRPVPILENDNSSPEPSILPKKRKSTRERSQVNYAELHHGAYSAPVYDEYRYRKLLETKTFVQHHFPVIRATDLTYEYAQNYGFLMPIIVPNSEGLGMKMPDSSLTVRQVSQLCGCDRKVDVLEVATQSEKIMTLNELADYWDTPRNLRKRLLNVISLEISDTQLGKMVERPKFVRDIDWIDNVWPSELKAKGEYPKVQLYCLMSVQDSYTDFHIDFAGSSKYEQWSSSPDQSKTFFGDLMKECYAVSLEAGNTMLIPSGWIHAVYTPADAVVIGGNFLNGFATATQLEVWRIEERTKVPAKFRFPYFEKMLWWSAQKYHHILKESPAILSMWELNNLDSLIAHLKYQSSQLSDLSISKKTRKKIRKNVPKKIKNVSKLITSLECFLKVARRRKELEHAVAVLREHVLNGNGWNYGGNAYRMMGNRDMGWGVSPDMMNYPTYPNGHCDTGGYGVEDRKLLQFQLYPSQHQQQQQYQQHLSYVDLQYYNIDEDEIWDSEMTEMEYYDSDSSVDVYGEVRARIDTQVIKEEEFGEVLEDEGSDERESVYDDDAMFDPKNERTSENDVIERMKKKKIVPVGLVGSNRTNKSKVVGKEKKKETVFDRIGKKLKKKR
ncbi:JmjC domain-containing histone demethylation protein 1 [Nowakowskiella sp. JEL0407]|nr:JmjC domain-containing histone demethylation protein 1 [Nowakowskiella sp. JEL0407]